MRNKLLANVDYYGNPPGWVPRLNLQSTLDQFQDIQVITQSLYFYATNMRDKYERLENANVLANETSDAIAREMESTRALLNKSVSGVANAREALENISNRVKEKQADIDRLHVWATQSAMDRVAAQRVFRGVMKTIGGLMKAVPVGQPYLGLAGDITSGIGDFNWNDPKGIGGQIGDTLGRIGSATETFLEKNKDLIKKDMIGSELRDRLKLQEEQKIKLDSDIDSAKAAIEKQERQVAAQQETKIKEWTSSKEYKGYKDKLETLQKQLKGVVDAIENTQEFAKLTPKDKATKKLELAKVTAWNASPEALGLNSQKDQLEAAINAITEQEQKAKDDAEMKVLEPLVALKSDLGKMKNETTDKELELKQATRAITATNEQIKQKEEQIGTALDRLSSICSTIALSGLGCWNRG